ncbi:hypothetical protein GGI12_003558 [Dipsacomyces acuminosporus]|nr:hypothetical protein GGI12_003558 [Dipsacomyces acuminosporus]
MAAEKCTLLPEQLFVSQEAFIAHVRQFAAENGFNVRLDDVERDKEGTIRKRDIVCSSEGVPRSKEAQKREDSANKSDADSTDVVATSKSLVAHSGAHRRKSMKTGCRWLARASRQQSGMWKIIMLRLEHNHSLTARFDLLGASPHTIRTGDMASISAAAMAATAAVENGNYRGPSVEFKNLFLQMSAACADLCWSAARHPDTISEVLSEIRRLNQHLEHRNAREDTEPVAGASSSRAQSALPIISEANDENADTGDGADADGEDSKHPETDGSLVMMARPSNGINHHIAPGSPPQPSHFLNIAQSAHQDQQQIVDPVAITESPAQLLARTQNRGMEAQSSDVNGSISLAVVAAAHTMAEANSSPAVQPAAAPAQPTGPVKRPRGRPRKNPVSADGKPAKSKAQQKREQQQQQREQQQREQQQREQLLQQQQQQQQQQSTPTPAALASLSQQIINQNSHQGQQQQQQMYRQPTINGTAASAGSPSISGINSLVLPTNSPIPGYQGQFSRAQSTSMSAEAGTPRMHQQQQQQILQQQQHQQQHILQVNPAMQTAQMAKDTTSAPQLHTNINPYLFMARAQQQQQQQQQQKQADRLPGMLHNPQDATSGTLPPLPQANGALSGANRRFAGFPLNQYQGLHDWSMQ